MELEEGTTKNGEARKVKMIPEVFELLSASAKARSLTIWCSRVLAARMFVIREKNGTICVSGLA
jgi:hypothetical protein